MPRKPSASSIPTLRMDDRFCKGDFSLLSSDQCIFRVSSKDILSRDKSALRHAVKTCLAIPDTNNTIQLDEPSPILRAFLLALLDSVLPNPSTFPIERYYALVLFATTLKATGVINILRPLLPRYLTYKKSDPYPIFQSAILFEDWYTAGDALAKHSKDHVWFRDPKVKVVADLALGCKPRMHNLDPSGLPYHYWMEMPKKVSWAMVRACADKQSWKERGERFSELMIFIEERDVVFPKWAAMEAEAIIEASSDDTSSDPSRKMDIVTDDQPEASPDPPSSPPLLIRTARLHSPAPAKTSNRIRLKNQEPLFLPRSSSPQSEAELPSEHDRRRVDREVRSDDMERDEDLLEGP